MIGSSLLYGIPMRRASYGSVKRDFKLGTLLLLLASLHPLAAQERLLPVYHFQHLSGLTSDQIRSHTVRDHEGFIWIGTLNGLNRYDGYGVKEYRNDPNDPHSLSSNVVKELFVDSKGRLWVGTHESGFSLYDPVCDRFVNFLPRPGDSSWYGAKSIYNISEDRTGNIWLAATFGGAVCVELPPGYDGDPDSISREIHFTTYALGTTANAGSSVLELDDRKILVGSDCGIVVLDPATHAMSRLHLSDPTGRRLDSLSINCVIADSRGDLWVGTAADGLFRIDQQNRKVTNYRHGEKDEFSIASDAIWDVAEDRSGNLWIGSGGGVDLFSPMTGKCSSYLAVGLGAHWPVSFMRMSLDLNGVLWVGTMDGGVHSLSPRSKRFPLYSLRSKDRSTPVSFTTVKRDAIGDCWFMTSNGILCKIDIKTGSVLQRIDVLRGKQPSYGDCASFIDARGIYWHGTWGLGLFRVDLRNGRVRNYNVDIGLGSDRIVNGIAQGEGDTLWIAKEGDGLKKFDPVSGGCTAVPGLSPGDIMTVMKSHDGSIWLSSEIDGIRILNPATGAVEQLRHVSSDPHSLSSNHVRYIHEDSSGRIWAGAGNMLNRWDPATHSFTRYNNLEFKKAVFADILGSDHKGKLWVHFLGAGMSVFDPSSGLFTNYDETDGISGDLTMENLPDGRVVVPHLTGVNIFDPDSIDTRRPAPRLVITRMSINDESAIPPRIVGTSPLLRLTHSQNVIEFEFAAIDIDAPHLIEYQYRLDGLEKQWVKPIGRRFVRYPGLSPGDYVFSVKATSLRGEWPYQEIAFAFSIAPPWWRTPLAYAAYGVLFLAFLYGVYRLRLQQIHLKQAVEMEHFQAEHLAQVDRLKSRFFSSISHEFRTPLTLILGPTDQLLEVTTEHPSQRKLQIIKDNANKLFALVNQLLDFSRLESGMMRLQVSSGDIAKFLRRVVMSFESWAERKKINLDFQADVDSAIGFFDAEKVEKIVNNLMSNALRFTPEGGAVGVSLRVAPEAPRSNLAPDGKIAPSLKNAHRNDRMIDGGLVIAVSDTGPGIAPEHLPHIFDRFYRADESHTTEGTGIGLALAKELIDLHHGTITVESAPGKGSTFSVVLPIDRSAYKPGEICETTSQIGERKHVAAVSHSAEVESAPTTPPAEGKPIVLLVEDNADLRVYMREYLELEYAVQEAGNGKEGYDQALEIIPDIVVADVMMPEMDGMDLCRALKQDMRTSHVPVILLTARAEMESKIEGLETGADDYLTKPFETRELQARIRNLIELRRKLRARFRAFVPMRPGEITVSSMDDAFLAKVAAAVERRMSDETFHVDELAAEAGMSRAQLHRKFIALTDQSPGEFIRVARLQRGMELLRNNAGTVSEIAYAVGFSDPSYFSKSFHRQFGKSPGELRQS